MDNIEHLYIIGNGFDIFTGLKTRYIDFRWWLENHYIFVYEALTSVYGADGEWWIDFETKLGELNVDQYIADNTPRFESIDALSDSIREKRDFEKKNNLPHSILFSDPCSSRLEGLLDILNYCFEKWVQSVQTYRNWKLTHLEINNSYYINFNYTDTLEMLYEIPEERVLHIHGRASKHEPLIYGHNKHLNGNLKSGHEGEKVAEVLNHYEKNPFMYIPDNLSDIIRNVSNIYVLGLSLSAVDIPYLEWVMENTPEDCEWRISWYTESDKKRISDFILDNPTLLDRYIPIEIQEVQGK